MGLTKIALAAGDAGKSKLIFKAANDLSKGQASLPAGLSSSLVAAPSVRVQVLTDNGACYETTPSEITIQEEDRFKAK